MGWFDVILFPLYVLAFYCISWFFRKRIDDPLLKKYHKRGFWVKVFGTLAFTYFNVYISPGDSLGLYYTEGINIASLISNDLSNINLIFIPGNEFDQNQLANPLNVGYFMNGSNYFIAKLVSLFAFVSFSGYMVINLLFSLISFSGAWRLYKFFYEQYPQLHRQLAIAILYLPTFVFWSSGILKDTISIAMLGFMTYSLYSVFLKRKSIVKNTIIALAAGYILAVVKSYILLSYLPFFISYLALSSFKFIHNKFTRLVSFFIFLVIATAVLITASGRLKKEMGNLAIDQLTETVKKQQAIFINIGDAAESSFSLGIEYDGTTGSLLRMAPAAIAATLFRPYLWEAKKLSTLLSSLESLALILFTLYVFIKTGPFYFFRSIVTHPLVMFCFFFSIVFALFVGSTTLNFGTLVRYKIPCMPFYVISLVLIAEMSKKRKAALVVKKQALP